jgi:hypothetical protein
MYTTFYAPVKPVILCEGHTDNVYLVHAIRRLAADFPELAEIKNKKVLLKVRIYKHPKSSTTRLLDLGAGGYASLNTFMTRYRKEIEDFGPGLTEPVVVVYDNDSGGPKVRNQIKQAFKLSSDGSEPFVHVFRNLYAVPTPFGPNRAQTEIEDLFDATTKATKLSGKSFSSGEVDPETQYGKAAFAEHVIAANASKVDFTGFKPLLASISAAIKAHRLAVIKPPPAP